MHSHLGENPASCFISKVYVAKPRINIFPADLLTYDTQAPGARLGTSMIHRQRRHIPLLPGQESEEDSSQGCQLGDSSDSLETRSPQSRGGKCCKMDQKQTVLSYLFICRRDSCLPRITSPCSPAPFALGSNLFITPGQNWTGI